MKKALEWAVRNRISLIVVGLFCFATFLSVYKLTESPPTWMDEGMILQTSKTFVEEGRYMVKVAPQQYISPGFISTSYPVTFPVALSFEIFGIGLLQARSVMVLYILSLLIALYLLTRLLSMNRWVSVAALALIVTFPPLYGDGKNVLGEVPGLFFLTIFLICVTRIFLGKRSNFDLFIAGVCAGLCVATKPIFILLMPAIGLGYAYVLWRRRDIFSGKVIQRGGCFVVGLLIPILAWIMIQFSGDKVSDILSYYSNPYKLDVVHSVLSNIRVFLISPQSLYFLALWLIWAVSVFIRIKKRAFVEGAEAISFIFATFVFALYFRDPGFYRYFFLAEIYALFFLPVSLVTLGIGWKAIRRILASALIIVVVFQAYQLFFTSWVAHYYGSTKTHDCEVALGSIPSSQSIFFYQTPELVIFRPGGNYYQYIASIENASTTVTKEALLRAGVPDMIAISSDTAKTEQPLLSRYVQTGSCERYLILTRK